MNLSFKMADQALRELKRSALRNLATMWSNTRELPELRLDVTRALGFVLGIGLYEIESADASELLNELLELVGSEAPRFLETLGPVVKAHQIMRAMMAEQSKGRPSA